VVHGPWWTTAKGGDRSSPESSSHGAAGLQNSLRWHENKEGAAVVLTDGFNNRSRGGDELATMMKWRR
jgi:hypothetical protein